MAKNIQSNWSLDAKCLTLALWKNFKGSVKYLILLITNQLSQISFH